MKYEAVAIWTSNFEGLSSDLHQEGMGVFGAPNRKPIDLE